MADLDDFFAKKDKKKSKTKKFTTADEIAKKLDTSKKNEVKLRKKEPAVEADEQNANQNEDEWREFEEERKDYTGLKIGTLTINEDNDKDASENTAEGSNDTDGDTFESTGNERKTSGPWKQVEASGTPNAPAPKPSQVQEIVNAPKQSVYVSPAYRNQVAASAASVTRTKKGAAPDLKNEEYFPTLGTEKPVDPLKNKHRDPTFEEVKHGSRVKASDLPHAVPLSIENRFTSLDNDAS